jgi:hypothetical protein
MRAVATRGECDNDSFQSNVAETANQCNMSFVVLAEYYPPTNWSAVWTNFDPARTCEQWRCIANVLRACGGNRAQTLCEQASCCHDPVDPSTTAGTGATPMMTTDELHRTTDTTLVVVAPANPNLLTIALGAVGAVVIVTIIIVVVVICRKKRNRNNSTQFEVL